MGQSLNQPNDWHKCQSQTVGAHHANTQRPGVYGFSRTSPSEVLEAAKVGKKTKIVTLKDT
jgi:hypothetical protein